MLFSAWTQALLDEGDECIIPVPYWVTYKDVVNFAGGQCVFVETDEDKGFDLKASMIEKAITPKTKMIMAANSPSNPSGAVFDRAELNKIIAIAKDRGIWVITDECYDRFLYDAEPYSLATPALKDTVIVAGSLSKTYAMTGWRIGFVLGPAAVVSGIGSCKAIRPPTRLPLRKSRGAGSCLARRTR